MAENIKNLGKVCITPEGVWDVNKEYDRLSLVVTKDSDTQRVLSYISRKHVPKGNINIKDTEYWQLFTTELKLEDITIDENGNVKIGDVVIYQIPLGDALGEIVVNKIKRDLTDYIMTEIRSYMTSMVQELINSFSNQIGRLISEGIKIDNNVNGTMHNVDEVTHYGNINLKHDGKISGILSGSVNTKLSGEVYINGDEPTPSTKYLVTINADPSDAIVTLNGIEGNSAEFDEGSTVIVVVSKSGYVTKTETITNIQQDTILNITLVAEGVQYFFRVNPTQKLVGASSSEFSIAVDSVKNNQRYDYEYEIEDVDGIIQSIVKETGGVKIITNANALDRQKNATIYFKQYRPEEEVLHVNIPLVITQETDNPSEYIFTSERINRFNRDSGINGLGAIPVGMNECITTDATGISIISTVNGNPCDYDVDAPSWFEIVDKDLNNNRCRFKFNKVTSETEGTITLTQRNSGKTLSFKILRINNLLYVINNPFTFDNKGHNEKLRVISCYNSSGSGFFYTDYQPALDENDNHPDWINISSEDFENARIISHGGYPTGGYFEVPIRILANTDDERNGVVKITNYTNKKYDIIIKQEGNVLEEYTFEFPNPSDNSFDFTNESGNYIEHDIDSYKVTGSITNVLGFNVEENLPDWLNIESVNNNSKVKVTIADNAPKVTNQKYTLQQIDSGSLTGETLEIYITTKDSPTPTETFTIEVNPITEGANVTMNDVVGNPQTFDKGSNVTVVISKEGYVTKTENINNLTADTTINGELTPVPPTYEFVGILTGPSGDYEQDLNTAIRLTTNDSSVTLTPRVKINGRLREDIDIPIVSSGFTPGAEHTDKFNVSVNETSLYIEVTGQEPSEPINTSYDITVSYDGHSESATFEIDWDV